MSLLRLLTTGKSLVDVRDTECRYRMSTQRLLPHFGSTRNPFRTETKPQMPTEAQPPQSQNRADGPVAQPNLASSAEEQAVSGNSAARRAPGAKFDPPRFAGCPWRRLVALFGAWRQKLSGLFASADRKSAKTAIPRFTKPLVQKELSLDRIRVVRNDLSDADLEVVPAKSLAPSMAASALEADEGPVLAPGASGRATSRTMSTAKP